MYLASSHAPSRIRPPSKRLRDKSLSSQQGDDEEGDTRPRNEFGYLLKGTVRLSDVRVGMKVAIVKKGFVYPGEVVGEDCDSSPRRFEVLLDEQTQNVWLSVEEIL